MKKAGALHQQCACIKISTQANRTAWAAQRSLHIYRQLTFDQDTRAVW